MKSVDFWVACVLVVGLTTAAYATQSPVLHYIERSGRIMFVGGNFYDGRATGEKLGNPAADQAHGPFLNPVEQALAQVRSRFRR